MGDAELLRRLFAAFNRGDFEGALALIDPAVEWGPPPDSPDQSEPFRGHEEMVQSFGRFMNVWESMGVDIEEATVVGDRVVVLTRWYGRSKGTGIEVEQRVAQVYEVRDGKVKRLRQFRTLAEAFAAAAAYG